APGAGIHDEYATYQNLLLTSDYASWYSGQWTMSCSAFRRLSASPSLPAASTASRARASSPWKNRSRNARAACFGATSWRPVQASGSYGFTPKSSFPQRTSLPQLPRSRTVVLCSQVLPPSQPLTLGG